MHPFTWDLRYAPIAEDAQGGAGATGAVPHRTYPQVNAPWAPTGTYTVRLTVDGKSTTQRLTLRLDPRVKTPATGLAQLALLSKEMYTGAKGAGAAFSAAPKLVGGGAAAGGGRAPPW